MLARFFAPVLLLPLLAGVASRASFQAQTEPRLLWHDVRSTGARATDLVFLPDGFTPAEQPAFEASVRKALRLLENQPASFVRAEREAWNVHVGFVPSSAACPGRPGEPALDTAFRTHLSADDEGGLFESDDLAIAAASHALAPGVDCVIVVVRSSEPIGFATGDLPLEGGRIRIPEGFESALLHELGHSLYALGDEYAGRDAALPDCEHCVVPFYPNVSLDPGGARFAFLCGEPVRAEEGALDFRRGVYRAAGPCVMRNPSADHFCPACAALIRAGRPAGPPPRSPRLTLVPGASFEAVLEPPRAEEGVVRRFAVLFRLTSPVGDEELLRLFAAAGARVSRKTRYMESSWLGDGSQPGEQVFSLEGQVTRFALGALEPGSYALVAASANLLALSPAAIERFTVPAPDPGAERERAR